MGRFRREIRHSGLESKALCADRTSRGNWSPQLELQTFVAETLKQIIDGVVDAQAHADRVSEQKEPFQSLRGQMC